jgi:hypothetical protein
MKTLKLLSCILMAVLSAGILMAEVKVPTQYGNPVLKSKVTRTTLYGDQRIPVVNLPEINITSLKTGAVILPVYYNNGILIAQAELPEVEISSGKTTNEKGKILIIDLPLVEISGAFPYEKLALKEAGQNIPVITLPEVNISGRINGDIVLDEQLLLVTLPEVNIYASRYNWKFVNAGNNLFEGKEVKWIYISLKNCGITTENNVICEIASATPLQLPGNPYPEKYYN